MRLPVLLLVFALVFALGCAAEPSEQPAYEPPGPWWSLDWDERFQFMLLKTQPEMEALFQAYDAEAFAEFTCERCHGEDPDAVDYAMPAGIAPLTLSDFPYPEHEDPELRAMGEFMEFEVAELMAGYLGQEVSVKELSCLDCHALAPITR